MGVAPLAFIVTSPSLIPKQLTFIVLAILTVSIVGSVTLTFITSGQSLSSSILIVYVPADNPENILDVCQVVPPLMEY